MLKGSRSLPAPVPVPLGGTGGTTAGAARTNLGVPGLPVLVTEGGTGGTDAAAARNNLNVPGIPVPVIHGGTGATNAFDARVALGIGAQSADYALVVANIVTANDVVDVFVHDTRLDSDGGAWAKQCGGTSWARDLAAQSLKSTYPEVAIYVLRNVLTGNSLTIYDALDLDGGGAPRAWMAFTIASTTMLRATGTLGSTNNLTKIVARNGRFWLCQGMTGGSGVGGFCEVNFPADSASYLTVTGRARWPGTIAERNSTSYGAWTNVISAAAGTLPDRNTFDVHAVAYPGSPLDPASGLPRPTVAVATAAGIAVLHPTGLVAHITSANAYSAVRLTEDGRLMALRAGTDVLEIGPVPYANVAATTWRRSGVTGTASATFGNGGVRSAALGATTRCLADGAIGTDAGLTLLADEPSNPSGAMVASIGTGHSTGWMAGDARAAWMCRGVTGPVSASGELVVNGVSPTDLAGWTPALTGGGTVTASGGFFVLAGTAAGDRAALRQSWATVVGETYRVTLDVLDAGADVRVGTTPGGGNNVAVALSPGSSIPVQFVATATTTHVEIVRPGNASARVNNISCVLVSADMGVRGRGLTVIGTLQRNPVAAGAELAAWSGFSAANYLELPPNVLMAFGTGDFLVDVWVNTAAGALDEAVFEWAAVSGGAYTGTGILLRTNSSGQWLFRVMNGASIVSGITGTIDTRGMGWVNIKALRRNGVMELWTQGVRDGTAANTTDLTNAAAIVRVGATQLGGSVADSSSIVLLRPSATAPTPAQIERMVREERQLLQANAKAFLGGTSSAVRQAARSRFSGRVTVGTGSGVTIFSGLRQTDYHAASTSSPAMNSDDVRAVGAEAGVVAIATATNAGVRRGAVIGLDRMPANLSGATPIRTMRSFGLTTDATPLNLAPRFFVGERESGTVLVTFMGRQIGAVDGAYLRYRRSVTWKRDAGGNVTITNIESLGVDAEGLPSADATVVGDTASQTLVPQVTGVASTGLFWAARFDTERVSEGARYEECDA